MKNKIKTRILRSVLCVTLRHKKHKFYASESFYIILTIIWMFCWVFKHRTSTKKNYYFGNYLHHQNKHSAPNFQK